MVNYKVDCSANKNVSMVLLWVDKSSKFCSFVECFKWVVTDWSNCQIEVYTVVNRLLDIFLKLRLCSNSNDET